MRNSTISDNATEGGGGGILIVPDRSSNNITNVMVNNSIIAGNSAPTNPDVAGSFISNGFNVIGAPGDSTGFDVDIIESDIANILDSALSDNGGSTQTHNLVSGSVAIDAVVSDCPPQILKKDQRGVQRSQGTACDIGAVEFQEETDEPIEVIMCEIRTEYESGNCEGKFNAYSLADLEAYKASNFGKDSTGKFQNLGIKASFGDAGDILDIESPCRIIVSSDGALAGDFVSLDARKGIWSNNLDIQTEGAACLLSEDESVKLKKNSNITAKKLVIQANKIAKIGNNAQVKVSDSLIVQATGSPSLSRAIIDKGANLLVGSNMLLESSFRAVIQNDAVVDVTGGLEMNAKTKNDCLVKNSAEISYGSKLGTCVAKLP